MKEQRDSALFCMPFLLIPNSIFHCSWSEIFLLNFRYATFFFLMSKKMCVLSLNKQEEMCVLLMEWNFPSQLQEDLYFLFFEISLTASLILKDWIVITLFCTCCFIGGYGVQDLCKWFNFFHIHYRVKFSDHALCFIQFLRVVSFQAPTVQCPIEKNRTGCFWFSISRDKNFPSIHLPGQKKRCVSIK